MPSRSENVPLSSVSRSVEPFVFGHAVRQALRLQPSRRKRTGAVDYLRRDTSHLPHEGRESTSLDMLLNDSQSQRTPRGICLSFAAGLIYGMFGVSETQG